MAGTDGVYLNDMDKSQGDILLCRSIMDHKIWNRKPLSKGQAWVELIMLAEFEPTKSFTRAGFIEVKRGEVCSSARKLASRWGWSINKVLRFLNDLKMEHMVDIKTEQSKSALTSVISILNYKDGQTFGPVKRTAKRTVTEQSRNSDGTVTEQSFISNNEVNKVNQLTNTSSSPSRNGFTPGFLQFWKDYPKKIKKHQCQQSWNKQNLETEIEEIMTGLKRHLDCEQWTNPKYIPSPLTFIHQYRWQDDPEPADRNSLFDYDEEDKHD